MKRRRALFLVVLSLLVVSVGGLVGGSRPALAVVSKSPLGTTAVSYAGTVHGQPENVFLSGLVLITRTVVRDPDFGQPAVVVYSIDFSNVTGQGQKTGQPYVTSGNQVLIRPLVATDVVDVIFDFFPSGGSILAARQALASFTFNYNTVSGSPTGTTTSSTADVLL